jgi:hypothetical protein
VFGALNGNPLAKPRRLRHARDGLIFPSSENE